MDFTLVTETSTKAAPEVFSPVESKAPAPLQIPAMVRIFVGHSSARTWQGSDDQTKEAGLRYYSVPEPEPLDFAEMQKAAENQDPRTFAQLVKAMKWENRHPSDLRRAIDLALSMEMVPLARQLAVKGRRLFPNYDPLRQVSTVLAPPVILGARTRQSRNLEASQRWLKEHASQFPGQWIAVREGAFLGAGPTLKELYKQIGTDGRTATTLIVRVLHNGTI